jgi:cytochrome bd-type quinol oxidase subunit 2
VLFIAAVVCAPWTHLLAPAVLFGATGLFGVVYVAIVARRTRRQTAYEPVFEDHLWYIIFPFTGYLTVLVAAAFLRGNPGQAMYAVAATAVLLLFTGIHNAWDSVTYLAANPELARNAPAKPPTV